jgi:hypothetical protein
VCGVCYQGLLVAPVAWDRDQGLQAGGNTGGPGVWGPLTQCGDQAIPSFSVAVARASDVAVVGA